MSRRDDLRLADIAAACRKIVQWTTPLTRAQFFADELRYVAVLRNPEIIGEASGRLSEGTRDSLPNVPWRQIVAFRNRVVHEYFGLDEDGVWDVVTMSVPALLAEIGSLHTDESHDDDGATAP